MSPAADAARAVLLRNPAAGRGSRRDQAVAAFRAAFASAGTTVLDTPAPGVGVGGLATALERLGEHERDLLLVAGGDGTLHLACNALLQARGERRWPLLALLPAGSANDGCRAVDELLRAPPATARTRAEALARAWREGAAPVAADLGQVVRGDGSVRAFANFAAVGSPGDWAALSAARWLRPLKRLHTPLAYQLCNLLVIARRRCRRIAVALDDDEASERSLFAWFAANARYLGGGMDLGEQVRLDSGRLAVIGLDEQPRRHLVRLLSSVRRGRGPHPTLVRQARLRLPAGCDLNLDGELWPTPHAEEVRVALLPACARWLGGIGSEAPAPAATVPRS